MLVAEKITAGYGDSMVLREVSVKVPDKQLVAILGSNGVGKTTLLKSIMGTIKLRSGTVAFDDHDLTKKQTYHRSELGIGVVPQGRDIFPFLSVHENLVLGLEARGFSTARRQAAADKLYDLFPILTKLRKRRGGDLSGGQQQILALARMLILEPKLLILDEPTEGIQPSIVQEIEDTIGQIKAQGVAILLVEQFADFALAHADYYYVMEHGQMSREGAVEAANRESIRQAISI